VALDGSDDIVYKLPSGEYRLYDKKSDPPPIYPADKDSPKPEELNAIAREILPTTNLTIMPDRVELDRRRWQLLRILKLVDESDELNEGPAARVGRLKRDRKILLQNNQAGIAKNSTPNSPVKG
jgi:hypothetical protein